MLVAEHPNDLVRDQYVMKLAGRLDIDPDRLRDRGARARAPRSAQSTAAPTPGAAADVVAPSTGASSTRCGGRCSRRS